ncbi:MAG: hypothetical protein A3H49_07650 [Nitrospirae bacterium RIFCSPLOWO2_02_FULL_62_14]|nr:MAG: hypothetical protein A3H49_07650 [Nitrospirae bacterium RIFCSPLOWO2_02_FULL_62_14]
MKMIIERSVQPVSLEPMQDADGLIMTIHGEKDEDHTLVFLSMQEARLLAYGLLAEAERHEPG